MPETMQEGKNRIPAYRALPDSELIHLRCEIAEHVGPLLLRLEAIDDEIMHRRRAERRAQILAVPGDLACEIDAEADQLQPAGAR